MLDRLILIGVLMVSALPAFGQDRGDPTTRELAAIMSERQRASDQRFMDFDKAIAAALASTQKEAAAALASAKDAISKSESDYNKRFDAVNEFRGTLRDQQQTFSTRTESELRFKAVIDRITALETVNAQSVGRSEGTAWLSSLLIGIGAMIGGLLLGGVAVAGFITRQRAKPAG